MHKKNKNNNRHSYHISSDFWNRKRPGEKRDKRKWEGHVMKRSNPTSPHSLPASSVATFGCLGRLRRSFLVYGHADISSWEGKKKKTKQHDPQQRINLKGKHLFGAWSNLLVEFWTQGLCLRSSVWFCGAHPSTRKGKLAFMGSLTWDITGLA